MRFKLLRQPYYTEGDKTIYINQSLYMMVKSPSMPRAVTRARISVQASSIHACTPQEDYPSNNNYKTFEVAILNKNDNFTTIAAIAPSKPYPKIKEWSQYYSKVDEAYNNVPKDLVDDLLFFYFKDTTCS